MCSPTLQNPGTAHYKLRLVDGLMDGLMDGLGLWDGQGGLFRVFISNGFDK